MKLIVRILLFGMCVGSLFSQDREAFYTRLNQVSEVVRQWQASEYRGIKPDSIFLRLKVDSTDSPVLARCIANAERNYLAGMKIVEERKQKAVIVPSSALAGEFRANKKNAAKKYAQQTINIEGTVSEITQDQNENMIITLDQFIRCTVRAEHTGELAFIETGTTHTFSGMVKGITVVNKTEYLAVEDCIPVQPVDIEEEKAVVLNQLFAVIDDFKALLPDEIVRTRMLLVEAFYQEGARLYAEKQYDSAKAMYANIFLYVADYKDVRKLIGAVSLSALYDQADTLFQQGKYREAYLAFFPLGYVQHFQNAVERFQIAFKIYYLGVISDATQTDGMPEYIAVFDSLARYARQDKEFCEGLFREWQTDFNAFATRHYKRELKKYILIPGGTYIKPRTQNQKRQVATFLIYPVQIDNTFLRAYFVAKAASLPAEIPLMFPGGYQESQKLAIGNWIGLHVIRDDQVEYIRMDGWASETERMRFNPVWRNFDFDPALYQYCISLEELRFKDEYDMLTKLAQQHSDQMRVRIEGEKEDAVSTGKIVVYKRIYVAPEIGYQISFDNWEHPDTSQYPPVTSTSPKTAQRLYLMRHDVYAGAFIGWNLQKKMGKSGQNFHGVGLDIRYVNSIKQSNAALIGARGDNQLEIEKYALSGLGLEVQYRASGESSNGLLGIGMMFFTSDYSLVYQRKTALNTSYTFGGSFRALSVTLGFGFNSFPYMRTQLFARTYVALGEKGQFKWMDETLSGNIMGGISFEVPLMFLRYGDI